MKVFYKFSLEKINVESGWTVGVTTFDIQREVLNKYSLNDITCEVLGEIKSMFEYFTPKIGYHEFLLHNGEFFRFSIFSM